MNSPVEKLTLRQKQSQFVWLIAELIQFAKINGYELTFGDAYRDPRVFGAYGEKKSYSASLSAHKIRLAVDFNLFQNGRYLTSTESHKKLGEFWKSIGGTWGGDWNDGNHYSYEEGAS